MILDRREQPHRHLSDVEAIIRGSALEPEIQESAVRVFRRLAEAEAAIHGTSVDEVHFHEVGAVDAIVDITGAVWGLRALGVERVYASSIPTGSGTVKTSHGVLPVPAPATLALLTSARAPLRPSEATTELVTPTGAALLASFATFQQPALRIERVGYGFGQKVLPWPNVARVWLGEAAEDARADGLETDFVVVLEANLDDERPEVVGAAMDTLLAAGALDVFFTPIFMKKNRPAVKLTVLAPLENRDRIAALMLRETSTLGVRTYPAERLKCRRWVDTVATPWGPVRIKVKEFAGEKRAAPEFDDCLALAHERDVPLPDVYAAARSAATAAGYIAP